MRSQLGFGWAQVAGQDFRHLGQGNSSRASCTSTQAINSGCLSWQNAAVESSGSKDPQGISSWGSCRLLLRLHEAGGGEKGGPMGTGVRGDEGLD